MKKEYAICIGVLVIALALPLVGFAEVGSRDLWEVYFSAGIIVAIVILDAGLSKVMEIATGDYSDEKEREKSWIIVKKGIPNAISAILFGAVSFPLSEVVLAPISHSATIGAKEIILSGIANPIFLVVSLGFFATGVAEFIKSVVSLVCIFLWNRRVKKGCGE